MSEAFQEVDINGKAIKFVALPANMRTLKLASPFFKKGKNDASATMSLVEAIELSLSYNYDEDEVNEILSDIELDFENAEAQQLISKVVECIFSRLRE